MKQKWMVFFLGLILSLGFIKIEAALEDDALDDRALLSSTHLVQSAPDVLSLEEMNIKFRIIFGTAILKDIISTCGIMIPTLTIFLAQVYGKDLDSVVWFFPVGVGMTVFMIGFSVWSNIKWFTYRKDIMLYLHSLYDLD